MVSIATDDERWSRREDEHRPMKRSASLLVTALVACVGEPDYEGLLCGQGCPSGFSCESDGRCHRSGNSTDASAGDGALLDRGPRDGSAGDGAIGDAAEVVDAGCG